MHHIRLHDLRHTHATLMLKAGIHPKIVSERLGHASISITLDTYSHVLPGLQKAAAEKFDRLFEDNSLDENVSVDVSKPLANLTINNNEKNGLEKLESKNGEPPANRTPNRLIKSQLLCQLS